MNYYRVALASVAGLGIIALILLMIFDSSEVETPEVASQRTENPTPRTVEVPSIEPATENTPVTRLPETESQPPQELVEEVPEPVQEQTADTELADEPDPVQLPDLNNSDNFVQQQIAMLQSGMAILNQLASQEIVRKFVILTENVSRGIFPYRDLPVLGPSKDIQVRETGDGVYLMEEVSYERFNPLVNTLVSMNTSEAVQVYIDMKPLFTQAYGELGLPGRDFDEVLLAAIDNVLQAETPQGPYELVQPNVMYRYADPQLENLSDVEKILLRMGPENAGSLKRKLMAFKQELLAAP